MFIIYCEADNSHCKVENSDVIYDERQIPEDGSTVKFFWRSSTYTGQVITYSGEPVHI